MSQQPVKIAIIQHPPVFMNLAGSLKKAAEYTAEAATAGANLVVFPETWLPGYPIWVDVADKAALWDYGPAKELFRILSENSLVLNSPEYEMLRQMARENRVYLVMGLNERRGNTLYNTILFIPPDDADVVVHRKLVPTYTERLLWGMGDGSTLSTINTPWGAVGGLVCWEHWMPLARAAMHALAEAIHIAQWPSVKEMHQVASRHYAFEGQCFVVAAGTMLSKREMLDGIAGHSPTDALLDFIQAIPGDDQRLLMRGGSAVIQPSGEYLVEPVYESREIIYASFDPAVRREGHLFLDTDGHYSRPDVFQLTVNDSELKNVRRQSERRGNR